ncbi:MAG: helix-turn-helix domain-containing protein [Pseudomonadota bacterium]|nr:helix-turn-helix domain-containing protein [Pseudomonadota bacterium]
MLDSSLENLLERLNVTLDAFATCEIGDGCGLSFAACDKIVLHFVLQGEGSIELEHGTLPIRPGMVAVIPKNFPKRINGKGAVLTVMNADKSCPLTPGIVKFRVSQTPKAGLVLGCALLSASVGERLGLFDHLQEPLLEEAKDDTLPLLFSNTLQELSRPGLGTKPIVEAMMKQILLMLLRDHIKRTGFASSIYLPLIHPQLGRALMEMVARPEEAHCVSSLAKLAGMSRSRFAHHFTETYGTSPVYYLQSVRLNRAARLLRSSTMPVKWIAAAVGFASRSHFSRTFREEFGLDPTAFRHANASGAETEKRHGQEMGLPTQRAID